MPGFKTILLQLSAAYKKKKDEIETASSEFIDALSQMAKDVARHTIGTQETRLERSILDEAAVRLLQMGDPVYGGFGHAPKFPNASNLMFLLRYYDISGMSRFRDFVVFTADMMAAGGIHDHLGGGFARYATDQKWLVPHFEKMLYDNALLSQLYAELYQITKADRHMQITEKILDYIIREMTHPDGGFYSAQDADSEHEEGKFYVWHKKEIASILGDHRTTDIFCEHYGVTEGGNFEGKNILNIKVPTSILAQKHSESPEHVTQIIEDASAKLFAARDKRVKPGKDEKILTAWNGLMISGFAKGYCVSGNTKYLQAAKKGVRFIESKLASTEGRLRRTFKDGQSKLNAYVEDYGFYVSGLLDLFAVDSKQEYLDRAIKYTDFMLQHFWDETEGNLFFTSDDHEQLIARTKNLYDLATPSGNSMAASNLIRLYHYTLNNIYLDRALTMMKSGAGTAAENPFGFGQMLNAIYLYMKRPVEVTVIFTDDNSNTDNSSLVAWLNRQFLPHSCSLPIKSQKELERQLMSS
jgi:uncharacterized protein YyaL (SSP411 family)